MTWVLYLLIIQAALGGFDVLWNHEYRERLPERTSAALEQKIHGCRELLYAGIFIGLAYAEWHGAWSLLLAGLFLIELLLTAWDFIIEDRTRALSPVERTTHLLLSVNGGACLGLFAPELARWMSLPDAVAATDYGLPGMLLYFFGAAVLLWGIRDLAAGVSLSAAATPFVTGENR